MFISLALSGPIHGQSVERYDIVISEIMADPSPTVALPAVEYVELHNRLAHACTLSNWSLTVGNSTKSLPTIVMDSAGYAVLIAQKHQEEFQPYCDNLYTLSSLSLTDGGQTLILRDDQERVVHAVAYRREWHTESIKQEGGWSLEMLDESLPCMGRENWNSSTSETGGTPGARNAAAQEVGDYSAPAAERLTLLNDSTIRIFFTETLRPTLPVNPQLLELSPQIPIQSIREVPPFFNALDITLAEALHPDVQYLLCVDGDLSDCAGNVMAWECLPVGRNEAPTAGDLVINEILFHPISGSDADFVEIYNRSQKIIDLKEVKIGSGGDTIPEKAVFAISTGRQLFPQEYCVLCKERDATLEQYVCPYPLALHACDSLPAFANSSGVVFLTTSALRPIDRFAYDEAMHFSGLTSTEGVSLERLRADEATQDEGNWHSAAATVGFATPGYQNSHAGDALPTDEIAVTPEVFSPDNDGFEDYAEISLAFTDLENRLTITVFDRTGRVVKRLVNNEPCGREALFRWDGTGDNHELLPSGAYILLIQWWNADGQTKRLRKVVGLRR